MNRSVDRVVCTLRLTIAVGAIIGGPFQASAQGQHHEWSAHDVGRVAAVGWAADSADGLALAGSGADIWGHADAFRFAYRTMTGDGEIVTRVQTLDYIHAWSKAGVMMRASLDEGSSHAFMLISAGQGAAFQHRIHADGPSTSTSVEGWPRHYVKLTRTGNNFDAYSSPDGATWNWVGGTFIHMPATIYVGVAVTSHHDGLLATATFSDLAVHEWAGAPAAASLLGGWSSEDVGVVSAAGWASASGSDVYVGGSGADIWGTDDGFHFVYRTLTGDGAITTRVSSLDWVDAWTKAGVMMRESLSAGSSHATMMATAGQGLAFQRRTVAGATSLHTAGSWTAAPTYLKLVRSGYTFTGYASADGWQWTEVGRDYIPMASTIYIGLAVTSHLDGATANAGFSGVEVAEGVEPATSTPDTGPAPAPEPAPAWEPEPSAPGAGTATLRIMHWNVHHGGVGTDGYYAPDRIARWIATVNPDVATLNEVDNDAQLWDIVSALNAHTGTSWHVTFAAKNAVLTRLPVHDTSTCGYGYTSQSAPRVRIAVNGRSLNVWSVHLNADAADIRLNEIAVFQDCLAGWSDNLIGGDFNMQPGSPEYWTATGPGYIDAWDAARNRGTADNYDGNCDGCTRNSRIDYVFSPGSAWFLTLESAAMIDTRDAYGYMPSDHKPMVVTYSVH